MNYLEKYNEWKNNPNIAQKDREELVAIADDDKEIKERFLYDTLFTFHLWMSVTFHPQYVPKSAGIERIKHYIGGFFY